MRKSKPKKRILLPDPKFHDVMVTRFVNNIMLQGKKSIAYSIFYDAIDMVGEKMKDSDKAPLDIWRKALENVTPQVEVKSRRVGGANFQVPTEVRPERKISARVLHSREKKICTEWQRPTRHLHISVSNPQGVTKWQEILNSPETSVSWPTLMPERQQLQSVSFIIQGRPTR